MSTLSEHLVLSELEISQSEIQISAIRSQGPGGQHVNKSSTAIHLRFDIKASSLPAKLKQRLLRLNDHRINKDGVVVIKAQSYRSQDDNKTEAIARLKEMIGNAAQVKPRRIPTKPTKGSQRRRLNSKSVVGKRKRLRGKVGRNDE